ncbi:hypothetical protein HA052_05110 [Chromobacterium haemolyticum]|uniref:Uncharacterized protein n=1 Tax=Chromobacterium fluminis TaxID=3044269 RepID=A0ABX0L5D8_9NEIS|nr:hypothetical protein [Chromobacterium haemolyticum]NHR04571.1 hypothetical protein [Chromobacterium haemolyticum]
MLKWIIGISFLVLLVSSVIRNNHEGNLQAARTQEQGVLLVQMEAINNPMVSQLVNEWRTAFPVPDEGKLTELKVLFQRVKANPAEAAKFTKEAKQKELDKVNALATSPLTGDAKAQGPGL